jgi:hypothetical protein
MAALGRKLLPLEDPTTATQRFAWLVRAIRSCHEDPRVRVTNLFAQRLNSDLVESLKPATINRLETGLLDFTLERCSAYERALKLPEDSLVDAYIWLMRHDGHAPRTEMARLREPSMREIELIYKLGRGEVLAPLEWIRLSYLYRNRSDLFTASPRLRRDLFERLVQDLGRSYEKNQRLMHEAVINIGDDIAPCIVNFVTREPVRYFLGVEALGFMRGAKSWHALLGLQERMIDPFTVQAILEAITRRVKAEPDLGVGGNHDFGPLRNYSVKILQQVDELFVAREAALGFLQDSEVELSSKERARLDVYREDLRQLRVLPVAFKREELIEQIVRSLGSALANTRKAEDVPTIIPGVDRLIRAAVFSADRQERINMGILMAPWVQAAALTTAVGTSIGLVSDEDYGTQRSMVRFATKINSPNLYSYVRRLSDSGVRDENTKLSLAWALGMGHDEDDLAVLERMYHATVARETKRAICIAAFRRGFASLLTEITRDRDGDVSREALVALSTLDG